MPRVEPLGVAGLTAPLRLAARPQPSASHADGHHLAGERWGAHTEETLVVGAVAAVFGFRDGSGAVGAATWRAGGQWRSVWASDRPESEPLALLN